MEAARQSRMIKNPYITILQRKYRPQLVIACIFMFFQQFDVSLYRQRIIPSHPYKSVAHSTRTHRLELFAFGHGAIAIAGRVSCCNG